MNPLSDAAEKNRRFQEHLASKGGGVRVSEAVRLPVYTLDARTTEEHQRYEMGSANMQAAYATVERRGARARGEGVPAIANPYRARKAACWHNAWQRGWERG